MSESRSAYRLFNAATFVLAGRTIDDPTATPKLHKVIEGEGERLA